MSQVSQPLGITNLTSLQQLVNNSHSRVSWSCEIQESAGTLAVKRYAVWGRFNTTPPAGQAPEVLVNLSLYGDDTNGQSEGRFSGSFSRKLVTFTKVTSTLTFDSDLNHYSEMDSYRCGATFSQSDQWSTQWSTFFFNVILADSISTMTPGMLIELSNGTPFFSSNWNWLRILRQEPLDLSFLVILTFFAPWYRSHSWHYLWKPHKKI